MKLKKQQLKPANQGAGGPSNASVEKENWRNPLNEGLEGAKADGGSCKTPNPSLSSKTVVVIRHGVPIRFGDFELSQEGINQIKESAEKLKKGMLGSCVIWTSPLLRALQSAEILAKVLEVPGFSKKDALHMDAKRNDVDQLVSEIPLLQEDNLILVTHVNILSIFSNCTLGYPEYRLEGDYLELEFVRDQMWQMKGD